MFITITAIVRILIATALVAIILRQIELYRLKAPKEVRHLKVLLLILSISLLTSNAILLIQWIIGAYTHIEIAPEPKGYDGLLYSIVDILDDIITVIILRLIYKEGEK